MLTFVFCVRCVACKSTYIQAKEYVRPLLHTHLNHKIHTHTQKNSHTLRRQQRALSASTVAVARWTSASARCTPISESSCSVAARFSSTCVFVCVCVCVGKEGGGWGDFLFMHTWMDGWRSRRESLCPWDIFPCVSIIFFGTNTMVMLTKNKRNTDPPTLIIVWVRSCCRSATSAACSLCGMVLRCNND
jgi:hypothetical protein